MPVGVVRSGAASSGVGGLRTCELSDAAAVQRLIEDERPSAIVHAAAWIGSGSVSGDAMARALRDNVTATASIAAAAAAFGVSHLVFCSSVEVYAAEPRDGASHRESDDLDPQGLYGRTKAIGEEIVAALDGGATKATVLRMPGLHGGDRRSGIVHRLLSAASDGTPIDLAEPDTRLSFLWVGDAARIIAAAAAGRITPEARCLNVASGEASLSELSALIGRASGRAVGVRPGTGRARNRVLDVSLMRRVLPFPLPPFERGLDLMPREAPAQ